MDGDYHYEDLDDEELCNVIERIDSEAAPLNHSRVKAILEQRGYIVKRSANSLKWFAELTPATREQLIGSTNSQSFPIRFGPSTKGGSWLEPARNDLRFVGAGLIDIDGISVNLSGRRFGLIWGVLSFLIKGRHELSWASIMNVEVVGNAVRFEYPTLESRLGAIALWAADGDLADKIARALPTARSLGFIPQLASQLEFERALVVRAPQVPATRVIIGINVLVFLVMALSGIGWMTVDADKALAWGANFGPYTTAGDWWRPVTAMFLHGGLIHLAFNMWALASFGPVVERLYGSIQFATLYVVAGITGGLVSVAWTPAVDSVGASGAILGILGALLATRFSPDTAMAREHMRPLRTSTFIFAAATLVSGLNNTGVDNAGHLGGLASGFLMGLILIWHVEGPIQWCSGKHWGRIIGATLAIVGIAGSLAAHRALSLTGDAQYYHTLHWFIPREISTNDAYIELGARLDNHALTKPQLASEIEDKVVPFWTEARDRFNAVDLKYNDALNSRLERLRDISELRLEGAKRCAQALRLNKPDAVSTCNAENQRGRALIDSWPPSK
jgi:membrane associated rhomboid family serine protease